MKYNNKRHDFGKWIGRAHSGKTGTIPSLHLLAQS